MDKPATSTKPATSSGFWGKTLEGMRAIICRSLTEGLGDLGPYLYLFLVADSQTSSATVNKAALVMNRQTGNETSARVSSSEPPRKDIVLVRVAQRSGS